VFCQKLAEVLRNIYKKGVQQLIDTKLVLTTLQKVCIHQNTSTRRQMQLPASDTTSEEDNHDMAPSAAGDDDDHDADAAMSNQGSVDDDIARTEKCLRLYFNSLAKSGTICTVEEEFNLVTVNWVSFSYDQNPLPVIRICLNKGLLHKSCSKKWKSL